MLLNKVIYYVFKSTVTFLMSGDKLYSMPIQFNILAIHTNRKQMKIILDTKSLVIGLSVASFAFLAMSNKPQLDSDNGKFRTEIRDNVVLILNTQNGDYLIATDVIDLRRKQWIKGEFYKSFQTAKDNNK